MAQLDKIRLSGTTYDIIDATAIHSLDGYYTTGETNAAITAATNALAESIAEQGYQTSGDVQNAISGKVDTTTYTAYTAATDTALGGKADTTAVTEAISEAVSGKLDTSIFQTYSGNNETILASKFAGATWSSTDKKIYFYDNASATGTALAYIDGTDFVKDGFLQSVTIENKVISGESVPCLVFIWNTDAGIQETDIPLSGIFDPTNYVSVDTFTAYTASTDTALGNKADTTAVTQAISEAVSGKADSADIVDITGFALQNSNTLIMTREKNGTTMSPLTVVKAGNGLTVTTDAMANKEFNVDTTVIQEKLVSNTNIKTINNTSILGSGNIEIEGGNKVEVSGTTLVFL